jgi:MATE family multidrug resistance protein
VPQLNNVRKEFPMRSIKTIIKLAAPISLFNLTTVLITIINGLFLAKLGPDFLAAGALIGVTQLTLMMIFSSPLFSVSPIITRLNAEKEYFQIGSLIRHGILFALLLSIPVMIGVAFIKTILYSLGQPRPIVSLVSLYFKAYMWSIPVGMLLTCCQQFMLGLKKTNLVTYIGLISLIVSVSLSYILTFGIKGTTPLGIAGLGYAQIARVTVALVFVISYVALNDEFKRFKLFSKRIFNGFVELKQIYDLGWPISLHATSEYLVQFSLTLIAGNLGLQALISQQISSQYIQFLSIIFLALSQSANLLVSDSIGKKDFQSMNEFGNAAIKIGVCVGFIGVLVSLSYPNALIYPYLGTHSDLEEGLKQFLIIIMIGQVFSAWKTVNIGILRGSYDTKSSMKIGIICSWFTILPLALIFTRIFNWGINGLALAQLIGSVLSVFLLSNRKKLIIIKICAENNIYLPLGSQREKNALG